MSQSEPTSGPNDPRRVLESTGKYRFIAELGRGAMGEVVEAEHVHLHTRVAIKLLHNEQAEVDEEKRQRAAARMKLEAQACAQLDHPNLLKVLDYGITSDGRTFLVSERLYGRTLRAEITERGFLPVPEAIDL